MPKLRVLCFGAGALGTYLGGSLALAGQQVVFLEQPSVAEVLRARGLRLDLTSDPRRRRREVTSLSPASLVFAGSVEEALRYGPFDVALYALKSFDTEAALQGMASFAERLPPICCFSNGVDNERAIAEVLGPDKVIPATVTSAVGRRGPGSIVLERLRGIGIASTHELSDNLLGAASAAFLNAKPYANAAAMKWSKLLTNLISNSTSAILDMTPAEVFSDPRLYELEIRTMRECLAVMHIQQIPVVDLPGIPVRALSLAARLPAWMSKPILARAAGTGRGGKMPSFHIDLHSGRGKSEVGYLNGAVVSAGRKFGVPTPVNDLLTETLLALTSGTKAPEDYARQPGKLLAEVLSRMSAG